MRIDRQEVLLAGGSWLYIIQMLKGNSLLPEAQSSDPEQQYELLDILGQGAYGTVSKALHKRTGNLYAIKILSASSLSEINSIKKEIQILKLCDNDHIVKYYGSHYKDNNLWIVLEYCHAGSIIDLINITQKKLNENEIASILESVIQGLVYLHSNKKIHRDIKAANILLNSQGIAKLADFGVSAQSMYTNAGHKSQVGSPYWMSPQVMKHNEYTNKTDIWSLGVTAIELAEGVVPNSHLKPLIAMWQLKDKPIQGFKDAQRWSPEFNSFVKDCLNVNPRDRPEAAMLLRHQFIVKNSRGQRLLAELVQHSLSDIEEFRRGEEEERSQSSEQNFMHMLNRSQSGTKTIINNQNYTQRSRESRDFGERQVLREIQSGDGFNSSMIINQNEGSMIINDNSMIINQEKEKPSAFLNKYISGLRNNENQIEQQKQQLKQRIADYDDTCIGEIEQVYLKYQKIIKELLVSGLGDQFFGMDTGFIKEEINSRLNRTDNVKDFLMQFPKYKEKEKEIVKEFQRSDMTKKKSQFSEMAHHSTQTNQHQYTNLSQFKDNPRGVKSQEFNQKEFKTNQKHCFNSKSIISDMENVKYSKDYTAEEVRFAKNDRSNKRFIVTEPYEWTSAERPPFNAENNTLNEKSKLKQQFLLDPDVKESLLHLMQNKGRPERSPFGQNTVKYDRIAESTLYHEGQDDTFKHQSSVTLVRGRQYGKNNYSQQDYLIPPDQDSDDINVNLFDANKSSTGKTSKNAQPKKKQKPPLKRVGSSQKRPGTGKANQLMRKGK